MGRKSVWLLVALLCHLPFAAAQEARPSFFSEGRTVSPWYRGGTAGTTLPSLVALVNRIKPAVVNISTTKKIAVRPWNPFEGFRVPRGGSRDPFDDFFERFFEGAPEQQREQHSLGSGFLINADGYILTNNHVFQGADEIIVKLSDRHKYPATIVGTDKETDIAVIKIKASQPFPSAPLGNSDRLQVGEWVVAIGNPFGLEQTITAGIVSAKGRVIGAGRYDNFIQTDASINPGNSGGPLFNLAGDVVGINTAIVASGQGIGFAIPINMAKQLVPQLITKGSVTERGWLGVMIQNVTDDLAESFGLEAAEGALVGDVIPGSPAQKAGLQRGDIIVGVNGRKITDANELPALIAASPPGQSAALDVVRDKRRIAVAVTVGRQSEGESIGSGGPDREGARTVAPDALGLVVRSADGGVAVARVESGSPAETVGVEEGDLIVEINGRAIDSVATYESVTKGLKGIVRLLIKRGNATIFLAFSVK
ncbi:MAG: DegQ family serine endoprotease [Deltaproteobacteria bacterium]|nr:DegQ family serine endoprotease [Deltaproteobacteria bacterium]